MAPILFLHGWFCRRLTMTDTQKIIQLLLPDLLAWIDGQNCSELSQKGLDNKENPSIHIVKKGVENGRK